MVTNLNIDIELLNSAQEVGGFKTKRETVNEALKEFILKREQKGIVELFGTIDYQDDYDYKKLRNR